MQRVVVALGGNSIHNTEHNPSFEVQLRDIEARCRSVVDLVNRGCQVVAVHGNGPQVGTLLIQNEEAATVVPAMPLHSCVAQTQGQLGSMFQLSLNNTLMALSMNKPVVTVVTHVVVSEDDPAFAAPAKRVGPAYTEQRARRLMRDRRFQMQHDRDRGWRRVVPSPDPLRIVEGPVIERLLDTGALVLAGGGGGIPVLETKVGYRGVDAVIEKDLAAQQLAQQVNADLLLLLTDVERVALDYGKASQRWLDRVSPADLRAYQQQGHFYAGSMAPKVEAAIRFVTAGPQGRRAVIGALGQVSRILAGESGTWIEA